MTETKNFFKTEHAKKVFDDRYAMKDKDGNQLETSPEQMWRRVADAIAAVEETEEKRKYWADRFYEAMYDFKFVPGGRILSGAGTGADVTFFNCFVIPSPEDSYDGIFANIHEMGQIMRRGGGVGIDLSTLRPKGDYVAGTNGFSSGPVAFAELYSQTTNITSQGGSRRGALMLMLRDDHPDIFDFVCVKEDLSKITGANLSVKVSDAFMQAIKDDADWELKWGGHVYRTIKARELWDAIVKAAHKAAEPGLWFYKRSNKESNSWYFEELIATNPCFTGDTKVWTAYGEKTFKELAERGEDIPVLTQYENGRLVYKMMRNPRLTRKNAELVEITVRSHRGKLSTIKCTPDHVFFLKDGTPVKAKDLQPGYRLSSVYRYKANQKGYIKLSNGIEQVMEHHVACEFRYGRRPIYPKEHAHHINGLKTDNRPENIELLSSREHNSQHISGENNPVVRFPEKNVFRKGFKGEKNGRWRHDISTEEIAKLRAKGMSYKEIAKRFNCSTYLVQDRLAANHVVLSVKPLEERQDVYCGTVDDTHKFFVSFGNHGVLVHNCGEQPLGEYGVCNLGAINLSKFVKGYSKTATVDWDGLATTIESAVRFLDNVIDVTPYHVPQNEKAQKEIRRIGLGTMGLADMLIKLGIRYGSDEAIEFVDKLYKFIANRAYSASAWLAELKGSFPKFDREKYLQGEFIKRLDDDVREEIEKFGIRNCFLLTQAPTGSTGSLAQVAGTGIEPVFEFEFKRTDRLGEHIIRIPLIDEIVEAGVIPPERDKWPDYMVTSRELTPYEHVRMQAAIQKWVDSSISKTVNAPRTYTPEDVSKLYMYAYDMGLKGITVYVDGSRKGVLNYIEEKSEDKTKEKETEQKTFYKRPAVLSGKTIKTRTPFGKAYVTINENERGEIEEIFVKLGKTGADISAIADGLAITLTGVLSPRLAGLTPDEKVSWIIKKFRGISGATTVGFGHNRVESLPDAIAQALQAYKGLEDVVETEEYDTTPTTINVASADICPECGTAAFVKEEGCANCKVCGYSRC